MIVQITKRDKNEKPIEAFIKGRGFELVIRCNRETQAVGRKHKGRKVA